jgi:hypothetical protein
MVNEKIAKIGEELKYIHSVKQQVQTIESRIVAMQRKVQEMRQNVVNTDDIRTQARTKIMVSNTPSTR